MEKIRKYDFFKNIKEKGFKEAWNILKKNYWSLQTPEALLNQDINGLKTMFLGYAIAVGYLLHTKIWGFIPIIIIGVFLNWVNLKGKIKQRKGNQEMEDMLKQMKEIEEKEDKIVQSKEELKSDTTQECIGILKYIDNIPNKEVNNEK